VKNHRRSSGWRQSRYRAVQYTLTLSNFNGVETAEIFHHTVPALSHVPALEELPSPVLAIHFRKGQTALRLFTTIATLGTPQDVTVQELRIECFFPADADTAQVFRDWAAHAPREPGSAR
jgi:hypothetical protein